MSDVTERPEWAHDAMSEDDIAFVEGYIDAVGWLPTAEPSEVVEFLSLSHFGYFLEMTEDHSFAQYKGYTNHPTSGICGMLGADWNDNGAEIGYMAGMFAALRIYRPGLAVKAAAEAAELRG